VKLFYHNVGQKGSGDFYKTVTKSWTWDQIEEAIILPDEQKILLKQKIKSSLGEHFNAWGVPEKANTWGLLSEGDSYVLLVETISIHFKGCSIPFGGMIEVIIPNLQPNLSQLFWQSSHFPRIYLFKTDKLCAEWHDLKDALGYSDNYRPPPYLLSVHEDRAGKLAGGSGPCAYIESMKCK